MAFLRKKKLSSSLSSTPKAKNKKFAQSLPATMDHVIIDNPEEVGGHSRCFSLATGSFSMQGLISLKPSPLDRTTSPHSHTTSEESLCSFSDGEDNDVDECNTTSQKILDVAAAKLSPIKAAVVARMPSTMFIRTADLPSMKESLVLSRHSLSDLHEDEWLDHVHKPSSNPPLPSIDHDPNESWVALDDGNGSRAPLAEAAVAALVKTGLNAAMHSGMWTPNGPTARILKSGDWDQTVFAQFDRSEPIVAPHARGAKEENDVLVWSGTFSHKYYGCDLPAIRCEGIVNMSPYSLANLLMDSGRVKEYNKMSIGRTDLIVLHNEGKCVTKVVVGQTKPPLVSKIMQLKTLLHMEELPGGGELGGYVVVSRAVSHDGDTEAAEDPKVVHSEMLMGVNVIRAVDGDPDRTILITLNHLRSPMVPMMLAKKIGLSAAVNFFNDIRALC